MPDLSIDTILIIVLTLARIALTDYASPLFKVCSVLANGPLMGVPGLEERSCFFTT